MKWNELLATFAREAGFFANDDVEKFEILCELIIKQCGYHADVFAALGCPADRDPTDYKPSDYIKEKLGVVDDV